MIENLLGMVEALARVPSPAPKERREEEEEEELCGEEGEVSGAMA